MQRSWFCLDSDLISEIDKYDSETDGNTWKKFANDCLKLDLNNLARSLKVLYNWAAQFGFLDKVKELLNNDEKTKGKIGILGAIQTFINNSDVFSGDKKEKPEVKIKNSQFEDQFNMQGKNENEILANIIYLSNALARIMIESKDLLSTRIPNINNIIKVLFQLKTKSMEELLINRQNGNSDGMLISYVRENDINLDISYFLVSIPSYFEPFRVQFDSKTLQELRRKFDIDSLDNIPFFSMEEGYRGEYLKSEFPFKLSPKLEKVLYDIYNDSLNGNKQIPGWILEKIKYYCEYLPEITTPEGIELAKLRERLYKLKEELERLIREIIKLQKNKKLSSKPETIKRQEDEIGVLKEEKGKKEDEMAKIERIIKDMSAMQP